MKNSRLVWCLLTAAAIPFAGCAEVRQDTVSIDVDQQLAQDAELALQEGRAEEAANLFSQLGEPLRGRMSEREALAWLAAGYPANAGEVLDQGTGPQSSNDHVMRAMIAWRADDANTAVAQAEQAIEADPDNAAAWALTGEFNLTLGQNRDAGVALTRAQNLLADDQPLKSVVSYNLATAHFIIGNFEGAYAAFTQYVNLKSSIDDDDRLVLGMMAFAMRDHRQAVKHWRDLDEDSREAIVVLVADESEIYATLVP